ncbi:toxin biosynthesis protein [Aspergillus sp. HF37]|nr:toxin biosynthesis protein [Aspergillus sp. HF37]
MREYPRGASSQNAPLKLAIKKYTPIDNLNPQPGDVTLIGAHGCGFAKELYEPLWEELLARCQSNGFRIRAIWVADAANQGASGIINENYLGNDPSWLDHGRDLLHMINHFRDEMPQPIMGDELMQECRMFLSHLHPRLLRSLLVIEPFIWDQDTGTNGVSVLLALTAEKKDVWNDRGQAADKARQKLRIWDPRVLDRWVQYGYRELPSAIHPDKKTSGSVTLSTSKHQELLTYLRANFNQHRELGLEDSPESRKVNDPPPPHDPLFQPDMIGGLYANQRFYRAEPLMAWRRLPHLRPSVLYLSGGRSDLSKSGLMERAAKMTGTGIGGSGGMQRKQVMNVVFPKAFHTLPFENVASTAEALAPWISQQIGQWREDERQVAEGWEGMSAKWKSTLSREWVTNLFASLQDMERRKKAAKL